MRRHHLNNITISVVAALASGCVAPLVAPESMSIPATPACFTLTESLEGKSAPLGLFNEHVLVRLERGAYIAVRENDRGIFFRGPPGGIQFYAADPTKRVVKPGLFTFDGGVFIPRDGSAVEPFNYISDPVPPVVPPSGASCATATVVRDPVSQEVRVSDFAIAGGVGGAAGGLAARAAMSSSAGYGKSLAMGAAGGLAAGAVVGAILKWESGKIKRHPPYSDTGFNEKLAKAQREGHPVRAN